jgi:hypothetical protein
VQLRTRRLAWRAVTTLRPAHARKAVDAMCSSASPALCHGIHRLFRTPVPRHRGDLGRLSRVVELAADKHRAGALPSRRLLGVGGGTIRST